MQVHDVMASTSSWPSLAEGEHKLLMQACHSYVEVVHCEYLLTPVRSLPNLACMQATQLFLLRAHRIRGVDLVATSETAQVDSRLHRLCGALSSSLELDNWKFDNRIKESISGSDASFAMLCQAAEALVSLVRTIPVCNCDIAFLRMTHSWQRPKCVQDFHKSDKHDPLHILNTFQGFTEAVIHFLKDTGSEPSVAPSPDVLVHVCEAPPSLGLTPLVPEVCKTVERAGMDSQVDVAIHTLVQIAPPALYYHLKVVEQLLWDPWGQSAEAQFAMLLMVSNPN